MVRIDFTFLYSSLLRYLLFCLILTLAFPTLVIAQPFEHLVNDNQGDYNLYAPVRAKIAPTSNAILKNCYAYTRLRFPSLPPTKVIQSNIQQEPAEVAVMQYGHLEHYAVVESFSTSTITISETNYGGHFKNIRTISREDIHLRGFYKLP